MRILLAGLVGGLVIFLCGALSHMATPFGEMGVSTMSPEREPAVLEAMKAAMTERKVYFFPGVDMKDKEAMKSDAYKAKLAAGPTGIIAFSPGAGSELGPRALGTELAFNVLEGLIAAFIVAHLAAGTSYARRVLIVTSIGLSAAISIDGSYWNWYRFPCEYFGAQTAMAVFGSFGAGLVIAKMAHKAS